MTTTTPRNCSLRTLRRRHAFGDAVRAARKAAGLPQWRLAELAECDRQTINRVENGAYSPHLDVLWRIADALGVPLSELCAAAEASLSSTIRRAS
jgi:putative transcriptional regulator